MNKISVLRILQKVSEKLLGDPHDFPEANYPVPNDLTEKYEVEYTGRDGNPLMIDIYRQKDPADEKLPVIVLLHGGALVSGHPIMERPAAEAFARKGYLVFVPAYRMISDADACEEIADVCAAFDFVLSEAESYGGDAANAYVIAESAAAYLAVYAIAMTGSEKIRSAVGYSASGLRIGAVAFVSGMFYTTKKDLIGLTYPPEIFRAKRKDDEFMALMDPENPEVICNLPPAILITCRRDFLRKYSFRFAEALVKAGRQYKLLYYAEKKKHLGHAFVTMWPDLQESRDAVSKIDEWFRSYDYGERA